LIPVLQKQELALRSKLISCLPIWCRFLHRIGIARNFIERRISKSKDVKTVFDLHLVRNQLANLNVLKVLHGLSVKNRQVGKNESKSFADSKVSKTLQLGEQLYTEKFDEIQNPPSPSQTSDTNKTENQPTQQRPPSIGFLYKGPIPTGSNKIPLPPHLVTPLKAQPPMEKNDNDFRPPLPPRPKKANRP